MNKLPVVLVDVDNVLEDLNTSWVLAINKEYGTNVNPEDITDWNIVKFFNGLSKRQVYSPLHTWEFWESLVPLKDSQKYLRQLKLDGFEVYILTSCHPDTVPLKLGFIQKHFPFIPFKNVIISSCKQMIIGDILIDDAPHNLEGGQYRGILMTAPHNKSYDETVRGFTRVSNWREIYDAVTTIAKENKENRWLYECNKKRR